MHEEQYNELVKTIAVVCELTGSTLSDAAAKFMVDELSAEPFPMAIRALQRCARECRSRLTLGEVTTRIDEERETDKARRHAALAHEETQLRIAALEARIPWEMGKEKVREMLAQIGKALPAPEPARERLRERSKQLAAHWQEKAEDKEP